MSTSLSDFNDLAQNQSLQAVARQIQYAIDNPKPFDIADVSANDEHPPTVKVESVKQPTPEEEWAKHLDKLQERYAQVIDDRKGKETTRVYDYESQTECTKTLFHSKINDKKMAQAWWANPNRKTIKQSEIDNIRTPSDQGVLGEMLERYMLIYGTKELWDSNDRTRYEVNAIRLDKPVEFDIWLKSHKRKTVNQKNIWFDPSSKKLPDDRSEQYINTFAGLPLIPLDVELKEAWDTAMPILQLLKHLCEDDEEVFRWVLNWLAIPLQRTGTKMDTALIFHGHQQGAGKSLFFDRIMSRIYGDYSLTLGQGQLVSQYNDWIADKLFVLFEEIFSGADRYGQIGMVKQLITGKDVYINKKFMSGWKQDNYVNAVFLSNDLMPLSLDSEDRRHVVCYPKKKIPSALLDKIKKGLEDNEQVIIRAFYRVLLDVDTSGQSSHQPAIMTKSKQELITLSQPNWETFYQQWIDNELEVKYRSCTSQQLYTYYKYWCKDNGEKPVSNTKLMRFVGTRENKQRIKYRQVGTLETSHVMMICVNAPVQFPTADHVDQQDWYGKQVDMFSKQLESVKNRLRL